MLRQEKSDLKIPNEWLVRVAGQWQELADHIDVVRNELGELGYEAFRPMEDFVDSCAISAEELGIHKRCEVEKLRRVLAQPLPIYLRNPELFTFESPFLRKLEVLLEQEVGNDSATTGGRWRYEPDPVVRRFQKMRSEKSIEFEERLVGVRRHQREMLVREKISHASGLAEKFPAAMVSPQSRWQLYTEAMELLGKPQGFALDEKKSTEDNPVFSKEVGDPWCLCFSIEDIGGLMDAMDSGEMDFQLTIRHKLSTESRGKIRFGEAVIVPYQSVIPEFMNAYTEFRSPGEMEAVIGARWALYGLVANQLEGAIRGS